MLRGGRDRRGACINLLFVICIVAWVNCLQTIVIMALSLAEQARLVNDSDMEWSEDEDLDSESEQEQDTGNDDNEMDFESDSGDDDEDEGDGGRGDSG